jgi:hypothetical protein
MDLDAFVVAVKTWWKPILPIRNTAAIDAKNDRQGIVSPTLKAQANYNFTSIQTNGQHELSYETSLVTGDLIPVVDEIKHLNVTFRVESYSQDPTKTAQFYCTRAQTRLKLPGILATFSGAGYAVNLVRPIIDLPFVVDQRSYSAAAFEIQFGVISSERVTEVSEEVGTIEHVEFSGTISNPPDTVAITGTVDKP